MIADRYFLDPTCKLYLPLERLDGSAFASRDQYGLVCSVAGAKWEIGGRYFDGNQDRIDAVGDELDFTTGDFTIVGCYKIIDNLAEHRMLYSHGEYQVNGYYFMLNSDGRLYFFTNQAGVAQYTRTTTADVVYGEWADYAVVRKGSSCRVFVNGTDVSADIGAHIDPLTVDTPFKIGLHNDDVTLGFLGWCKCMAVYGEAKSATWLRSLYESRL